MAQAARKSPFCLASALGQKVRRLALSQDGSTMMIFALLAVPVVGMVGVSVDLSRSSNAKSDLRAALDASLLSAAREGEDGFAAVADTYFDTNTADLAAHAPAASFSADEQSGSIVYTGEVTASVKTTFASLLGISAMPVRLTASVTMPQDTGNSCIWVLDENANHALTFNSQASVAAPDCSIQVHSRNQQAAAFNSGIDINFSSICVAGAGVTNNYGPIDGLQTNCAVEPDPFAATMPAVTPGSCDYSNKNYNGGNITLHPGTYCGHMNFNNGTNVTFTPGLYVFNGSKWNVNGGRWDGTGVSFYFHDQNSGIQFNSAVTSGLTPPGTGPYEGVMMFEAPGLPKSNFVFNDSEDFSIEGLIYLPSRDAIYNSNSVWRARKLSMVFNTLKLNQTRWSLTPGATSETPASDSPGELRISS